MKIYLDSIGCRLNQAEIERYACQFLAAGHSLVADPEKADLAVINTCAVTDAAVSDSRQKIRRAVRAGVDQVIVTGCWATLRPQEAAALSGVCRVIPNQEKDALVLNLLAELVALQLPLGVYDWEPIEAAINEAARCRQPIPGSRLRTRAFIKVQDGCNNRCTFCITTLARGPARSRSIDDVLEDIWAASGAKEVVLTGLHLGSWGQDFSPPLHLFHLVQAVLDQTDLPRLRLSSLEPWDLDDEFFRLWENPRLCQHLHLPLQSGCAATLRRMGRKTTPESYARLVLLSRTVMPEVAITTDVITGFPGESETEFLESLAFVRAMRFAGGHVFTYSARPGTAAVSMPGQVPLLLRKERNTLMRAVFREAALSYRASFIDQVLPVLWEDVISHSTQDHVLSGLTGNYLRVNTQTPLSLWNQITPVLLTALVDGHIEGKIIQPGEPYEPYCSRIQVSFRSNSASRSG